MNAEFTRVRDVPQGAFRFIALDVETANGDAASICQIGIACVQPDNHIQCYATYVNPEMPFEPFNSELHGIDAQTVSNAPLFPQIWARLLPLLAGHHLIQHSNFDKNAINAACAENGLPDPALQWSDSVGIARRTWPRLKGNGGHGLGNLKKILGLEFEHHDAGEDARAAALVVLHAEEYLEMGFEALVLSKKERQLSFPF
ncbi:MULTISPECIES: exonuclease domain-containing protein [Falsihalocynthiibacter]|uniref:exonuclease domain-containing protein n=1 Tax=Falsihalocynthiibacter TaxID=2854182 RepID=UPI0030017C7C